MDDDKPEKQRRFKAGPEERMHRMLRPYVAKDRAATPSPSVPDQLDYLRVTNDIVDQLAFRLTGTPIPTGKKREIEQRPGHSSAASLPAPPSSMRRRSNYHSASSLIYNLLTQGSKEKPSQDDVNELVDHVESLESLIWALENLLDDTRRRLVEPSASTIEAQTQIYTSLAKRLRLEKRTSLERSTSELVLYYKLLAGAFDYSNEMTRAIEEDRMARIPTDIQQRAIQLMLEDTERQSWEAQRKSLMEARARQPNDSPLKKLPIPHNRDR